MTFTEAAIEVLRREGKPLHFKKLAEIAVRENLLDHVGKIPEETMADQLAAHCRLPRTDRRVIPVQQGTFALAEWGLDEDPLGLDGLLEPPPEGELPYRGRERHPVPSRDLTRTAGRGEGGRARRRDEEERRDRRFPPPAEVAYEILAGAGKPLPLVEIAANGAERLLMPDAFVRDVASLRAALAEDNRRRESTGRKPLFQIDGDDVTLVAQPEPGERPVVPVAPRAAPAVQEIRRAALASLRRRLRECDAATVEHVAGRLLEKLGFKDLKVAKRGKEHVVCTAKRRMGLADVRHAIRIVRSGADAVRRDVVDVRRDLGHYGGQIGFVITAGEAAREARGEAAAAGQLPVLLLCGEALAEAFADAGVGCVPIVVPEVDEGFFKAAAEMAEREEIARRARREEREKRGPSRREEAPPASPEVAVEVSSPAAEEEPAPSAAAASAEPAPARAASEQDAADRGDDDDEEGDDDDESEAGEEGEAPAAAEGGAAAGSGAEGAQGADRRRRRRRRRRRGGRGRGGREGAPPAAGGAAPAGPSSEPIEISVGPRPAREPTNGEGGA